MKHEPESLLVSCERCGLERRRKLGLQMTEISLYINPYYVLYILVPYMLSDWSDDILLQVGNRHIHNFLSFG